MSEDRLVAERAAIGAIELSTIARGVVVLDQMAKRAETTIVANRSLSPGRYLIVVSSTVAEVEEAMDAALYTAGEDQVDSVILRDPHPRLRDTLSCRADATLDESLMIVETATVCAALLGADRALKEADVAMLQLRLGSGLSGKGIFTLTGALHMVEAAREAVERAVHERLIVRVELIAQPHPDLPAHLLGAEPATPRSG